MQITKEQAQKIIDAADEVITALAGTNEDVHPESDSMLRLWDDLNDRYAPPEVVRELARIALASLEAEPVYFVEIDDGQDINAGRIEGKNRPDLSLLPDGINHLYAAQPVPVSATVQERQQHRSREPKMTSETLSDEQLEELLCELEASGFYSRQLKGLAELQQHRAADKNYFMYGIADPDGNPYFDECCVSADQGVIEEEVNALGEGYRVVALYTALPLTDSERAELQEYRKAAEYVSYP
ncbi:TPA: hypothetical protein ACOEAK_003189 [Enterobacter ludwigii]